MATSSVSLVLTTDGRGQCLCDTIDALKLHIKYPYAHKLIVNDSGDTNYATWLNVRFPAFTKVHHKTRRGFGGAVASAWEHIPVCDYILTVEDDMVVRQDVKVDDLITILNGNPQLAQVVLLRQAWNESEKLAGGIMQQHPDAYTQMETNGIPWVAHNLFYSTNINLMPYGITRLGWPMESESEGKFGLKLKEYGYSFAFYGRIGDAPRVEHIGRERVGMGY